MHTVLLCFFFVVIAWDNEWDVLNILEHIPCMPAWNHQALGELDCFDSSDRACQINFAGCQDSLAKCEPATFDISTAALALWHV